MMQPTSRSSTRTSRSRTTSSVLSALRWSLVSSCGHARGVGTRWMTRLSRLEFLSHFFFISRPRTFLCLLIHRSTYMYSKVTRTHIVPYPLSRAVIRNQSTRSIDELIGLGSEFISSNKNRHSFFHECAQPSSLRFVVGQQATNPK
jgi:hypothetical protein